MLVVVKNQRKNKAKSEMNRNEIKVISEKEKKFEELKRRFLSITTQGFKEQLEVILDLSENILLNGRSSNIDEVIENILKVKNYALDIKNLLDEIYSIKESLDKIGDENKDGILSEDKPEEVEPKKNIEEHLFVTEGNKPQFIKINNIECITAFNEYTNIYLNNSKKIVIRKSLREWEGVLPDTMFIRIHRSTIINYEYVDRVEKFYSRSYVVYLKNINQPFVISQRYLAKLKKKLSF